MPTYNSFEEHDPEREYRCCTNPDGTCSNCGECCTDWLPMSGKELKNIKRYVAKHDVKEHWHEGLKGAVSADFTCPFHDQQNHKCLIYPVRPQICREFICSKPLKQAHADRDRFEKEHRYKEVCLRSAIYGNNEEERYICIQLQMHKRA